MGEPQKHYAKWNKDKQGQMLYYSTYLTSRIHWDKLEQMLSMAGKGVNCGRYCLMVRVSVWDDGKCSWNGSGGTKPWMYLMPQNCAFKNS